VTRRTTWYASPRSVAHAPPRRYAVESFDCLPAGGSRGAQIASYIRARYPKQPFGSLTFAQALGCSHLITRHYVIGLGPPRSLLDYRQSPSGAPRTNGALDSRAAPGRAAASPQSSAKRAARSRRRDGQTLSPLRARRREGPVVGPLSLSQTISQRSSLSRPGPPGALRAAGKKTTWISGEGGAVQACDPELTVGLLPLRRRGQRDNPKAIAE
jgi:hypothetical protein